LVNGNLKTALAFIVIRERPISIFLGPPATPKKSHKTFVGCSLALSGVKKFMQRSAATHTAGIVSQSPYESMDASKF